MNIIVLIQTYFDLNLEIVLPLEIIKLHSNNKKNKVTVLKSLSVYFIPYRNGRILLRKSSSSKE